MDAEANIRAANGPEGKRRDRRASSSFRFIEKHYKQRLDSSFRWNDELPLGPRPLALASLFNCFQSPSTIRSQANVGSRLPHRNKAGR
jgi:hypothetical protein